MPPKPRIEPIAKLALDVQFSKLDITRLRYDGFDVAVVADIGESDRSWLRRAAAAGVDMVCSPDADCEIWAYDRNLRFCKLPGNRAVDKVQLVTRTWSSFARRVVR